MTKKALAMGVLLPVCGLAQWTLNNPSGSFTSGNFGRVTSAKAGRIGRMSLKLLW